MNRIEQHISDENKRDTSKYDKVKILITVPTMGAIQTSLVTHLILWAKSFPKDRVAFYFTFKVAPVQRARNEIVRFFLSERKNNKGEVVPKFTHLLFVDSDTLPPRDAIFRLLDADKDVVTGVTPMLQYDKESATWGTLDNCFTHQEDDAGADGGKRTFAVVRNTGLKKIWRCGASCLLIKREVFEKLEKPYFDTILDEDGIKTKKSEDLYFCDKVHEAGMEIWCDTSVICNHFKDVQL